MKNYKQTLKRCMAFAGTIFFLTLALTSCSKKNEQAPDLTPVSLISVINLSPGTEALDFFIDQNKANSGAFGFGQGYDYVRAYAGKRTAKFTVSSTGAQFKSDTLTLAANKAYTLFLVNKVATPEYVLLKDTLDAPAAGKTNIRFANFSPDAPAVDFAIKGGAVLSANKAFKGYSPFIAIDGNNKITIEVRQAGTSTVLASLSDITPKAGYVYTIWLQGLVSATDQTKLSVSAQLNAYY